MSHGYSWSGGRSWRKLKNITACLSRSGTFLYAYINDENAEDAYDRITTKSDAIYNGMMSNKDLAKEISDCQTVYSVANQYTIANVLAQPAQ